jgi:lysozyme family protein
VPSLTQSNEDRWSAAAVRPSQAKSFTSVAKRLVAGKSRYQGLEAATGVPWFVISVIHEREASQRWDRSIAQGDPWNRVSIHVPRGRGPFRSFEDAAVDALVNCAPFAAKWTDFSAGGTLTLLEHYNGLGYYKRGLPSPYIWAGTNQYSRGKYTSDGKFDPNQVDSQLGCAGLIMAMAKLDDSVSFGAALSLLSPPDPEDPASDSQAVAPDGDDTNKTDIVPPEPEKAAGQTSPVNVQEPTAKYNVDVEILQHKLIRMNYHEVGDADGYWGGKTRGAVTAFMNDRGQKTDGNFTPEVSAELSKALTEGWTRPIAPARANANAKDLSPKVEVVRQTLLQRFWAKISATFAALGFAGSSISSYWHQTVENLQPVHNFLSGIPPEVWFLIVGLVAGVTWYISTRATDAAVKDFNTGRIN